MCSPLLSAGAMTKQEMAECHLAHEGRQKLLCLRRVLYWLGLCPGRAGNLWCAYAAAAGRLQILFCLEVLFSCQFLGFMQVSAAAWSLTYRVWHRLAALFLAFWSAGISADCSR